MTVADVRCHRTDLYVSQCACARCRPPVRTALASGELYDLRGLRLLPGPYDLNTASRMYHRPQCSHASRGERTDRWDDDVPSSQVLAEWARQRDLFVEGGESARTAFFCMSCVSERA